MDKCEDRRRAVREWLLVQSSQKLSTNGLNQRNSQIAEHLRKPMNQQAQAVLDPQVVMSLSELLDGWSPQRFLAERMIIMVPYFRSKVLKFILHGRNSGQRGNDQWMRFGS